MKIYFLMLLAYSTIAEMFSNQNQLEDLFFMSEQEEKSLESNALKNVVIEKVKARILNSLQLKEAPKHHRPSPLLQAFRDNSWSGRLHDNSTVNAKKSEFFQSEIVPNTCFLRREAHCLRFQINLESFRRNGSRSFAEIWLYKKKGIKQFEMSLIQSKHHYQITNQSDAGGWIRLDVSVLLNRISSSVLDLEVSSQISVPLEIGRNKSPLLVIHEETRVKRSIGGCQQSGTSCCVKSLYVSFREIGWDSWIVQPEGYSANICKGSCENRIDLAAKHHTTIMILMMGKRNEINDSIHCTPKQYKPLSIIYTDESGVKVISNLPNMSVSACSCS